MAALLAVSLGGCSQSSRTADSTSTRPDGRDSVSLAATRIRLTDVAELDSMATGLAVRRSDPALYAVRRDGMVERVVRGRSVGTVLDLRDQVTLDGEGGAFDAAFTTDGRELLVSYADRISYDLVVTRVRIDPHGRPTGSPTEVVRIGHGGPIHNSGRLLVSGEDLLVGVGDGGELLAVAGAARMENSLRGRILRFVGLAQTGAATPSPRTVAFGLRNPWRFFVDPATRSMWIGDVGQARWEEVDLLRRDDLRSGGRPVDFGWDLTEGFERSRGLPPPDMRFPQMVVPHADDHCAIVGGPVVRDRSLTGAVGALLLGDFCSSEIRFVRLSNDLPVEKRSVRLPGGAKVVSFATDRSDKVYVLRTDGIISRIDSGTTKLAADSAPLETGTPPTFTGPRAICGLSAAIAGYPAMTARPPEVVRVLADDLIRALDAYRAAELPTDARRPFEEIDDGLRGIVAQIAARDYVMTPGLEAGHSPATSSGATAFAQLSSIEAENCATGPGS